MAEGKEGNAIRLDGSMGLGMNSHLTLITADRVSGKKETTYEIPHVIIHFDTLKKAVDNGFILGFSIEKIIPSDAKALILDSDGFHFEEDNDENRN